LAKIKGVCEDGRESRDFLCKKVLNFSLDKSESFSDLESSDMGADMKRYAASDAQCSLKIFGSLCSLVSYERLNTRSS
jgi:ribonuclease D